MKDHHGKLTLDEMSKDRIGSSTKTDKPGPSAGQDDHAKGKQPCSDAHPGETFSAPKGR